MYAIRQTEKLERQLIIMIIYILSYRDSINILSMLPGTSDKHFNLSTPATIKGEWIYLKIKGQPQKQALFWSLHPTTNYGYMEMEPQFNGSSEDLVE